MNTMNTSENTPREQTITRLINEGWLPCPSDKPLKWAQAVSVDVDGRTRPQGTGGASAAGEGWFSPPGRKP